MFLFLSTTKTFLVNITVCQLGFNIRKFCISSSSFDDRKNAFISKTQTHLGLIMSDLHKYEKLKNIPSPGERKAIYQNFHNQLEGIKALKEFNKNHFMLMDFDYQVNIKYQNLEELLAMKEKEDECSLEERTAFFINSIINDQKSIYEKYSEIYRQMILIF